MLGNMTNIVLDYVFIVIFGMGTAGAAIATSLGFTVNTVYYLIEMAVYTKNGGKSLPVSVRRYRPTLQITKQVFSIGIPGALITVLLSAANIFLNNYIALYGSEPIAAYGIAYKINSISVMLSVGLSQGVTPLIGYHYGARNIEKLRRTVYLSLVYGTLMGLFFLGLFIFTGSKAAGLFLSDGSARDMAARFLYILSASAPVISAANIITSYYQASGKAIPSLVLTVLKNVILFMPAVILFNRFWNLNGVIAAAPAVDYLTAVIGLCMYRRSNANAAVQKENRASQKTAYSVE